MTQTKAACFLKISGPYLNWDYYRTHLRKSHDHFIDIIDGTEI
jgi:hypothetical protein